jgi:hypothetical protein
MQTATEYYILRLHEYYTPFFGGLQADLGRITFFVNYAEFYVNAIM